MPLAFASIAVRVSALMSTEQTGRSASPALVGIAAWAVPGLGYILLREWTRGIVIGVAVILLFLMGILIGGIRIMDPPGWGEYGYKTYLVQSYDPSIKGYKIEHIDPQTEKSEADPTNGGDSKLIGWSMIAQPVAELGDKPWFVGQILCGPITFATGDISIHEARASIDANGNITPGVAASHARSWEIGTLYTAVAGMLNLLAIIDSVNRASSGNN